MAITGKSRTGYRFRRTIRFESGAVRIEDEFPNAIPLKRLSAGSDATSIYVANSNVYQESVMRVPWRHASEETLRAIRAQGGRWELEIRPGADRPVSS